MKQYGLLGKSLGYSFSQSFFESYFEKNAIEADFLNIEIPSIDQVTHILKSNLSGLCVTIPYKESNFLSVFADVGNSSTAFLISFIIVLSYMFHPNTDTP